jgi:2-oxoisovalerate dehydrogenase E1 component
MIGIHVLEKNNLSALHPAFDWYEVARLILTSRAVDELEEQELVPQGYINYQFSARGHELGQVLLSQLMTRPFDAASAYYRSRPFVFGSGLTIEEALASDMARAGGFNDGRDIGVVFNLPRRERATILPMAADVGAQFTPAVGWAQAIRYRVEQLGDTELADSMAVIFSGDGAVASNGFWSALTIATTLELPVLFMVEDNGYAISVQSPTQTPGANIAANLAAFKNLAIWDGSGTNPQETAELVVAAVDHIRAGKGAALLRLTVPRLSGHSSVDNQAYKSPETVAAEWERDPIPALKNYLVPALMTEDEWSGLQQVVKGELQAAKEAAMAHPFAEPQSVTNRVFYAEGEPQLIGGLAAEGIQLPAGNATPNPPDPRRLNMLEAIRRTLDVELSVNPRCVVFGEDVGMKGGVHAATLGLQATHGERRVFDTSLSEEGIIGRAVGMAYAGLMPVPEIQYRKYADPATEHINNCGTIRWRTNNRFAAPMVIRMAGGYRRIGDPWHSVTSEATYVHQPGWKVAVPSNAEDAVGLLRAAMRGNDPVIFLEHRAMLDASWARRPYPGDEYVLPFGQANIVKEGSDLTVVTWGGMVERCEQAASEVEASVEIIDLRTLAPWDKDCVLASVKKTGKCLIVHEEILVSGFGAEIAATIAKEAFVYLDAPIERMGAPSVPVPFSTALMEGVIPQMADIRERMCELLKF